MLITANSFPVLFGAIDNGFLKVCQALSSCYQTFQIAFILVLAHFSELNEKLQVVWSLNINGQITLRKLSDW